MKFDSKFEWYIRIYHKDMITSAFGQKHNIYVNLLATKYYVINHREHIIIRIFSEGFQNYKCLK